MPEKNSRSRDAGARVPARGVLLGSEDCGGACALMEYLIAPGMLVAPLHRHEREDEYSYVVEGMIGAQIGEQVVQAGALQMLTKPRGVPHTLWNPGDVPARVVELIVPGGFEKCLAELYRPDGAPSPARQGKLWAQYAIEIYPDSVPGLLRQHRLRGIAIAP